MPAPAPQATISLRSASFNPARSASRLAMTAPACFGAPSRPSEAPMATMTSESAALPSVRKAGIRPAENHSAVVVSMALPEVRRLSRSCPSPVSRPAPTTTSIRRSGGARCAAARMLAPGDAQARCWIANSADVSSAAPAPAPTPVSATTIQNRAAPGWRRDPGMPSDMARPSRSCAIAPPCRRRKLRRMGATPEKQRRSRKLREGARRRPTSLRFEGQAPI